MSDLQEIFVVGASINHKKYGMGEVVTLSEYCVPCSFSCGRVHLTIEDAIQNTDLGSVLRPDKRLKKQKPFNVNKFFLISNTMLRYIPEVFNRDLRFQDLSGSTTSFERSTEEVDLESLDEAQRFVDNNPEFIELCRKIKQERGSVPMQFAAELYRYSLEDYDIIAIAKNLKSAAIERKIKEHLESQANEADEYSSGD